jgi:hypothetical protein
MQSRILPAFVVAAALSAAAAAQVPQEKKPVPKDSVRLALAGCTKGYVFTVGARMGDVVNGINIPPGAHLRMNGAKKLITEIDAYKDSMVAITGLMKKGQFEQRGVGIGPLRLVPVQAGTVGGPGTSPVSEPPQIDVEGWAPATGQCPS